MSTDIKTKKRRSPQRFDITDRFLKDIKATGSWQTYADRTVIGFEVKVSPRGVKSFTGRTEKPDGTRGRFVVGHYPDISPSEARKLVKSQAKLIDKKRDTEAERLERKLLRTHVDCETSTTTIEQFINDEYLPFFATKSQWSKARSNVLKSAFKDEIKMRLNEVNRSLIEVDWRNKRIAEGLANGTINRDLAALRAVLSYAVKKGRIPANPLSRIQPFPEADERVRYLDDDQERALLQALDAREERKRIARDNYNQWLAERKKPLLPNLREQPFTDHLIPMIVVSRETGVRFRELAMLQWKFVDLKHRAIFVRAATCKTRKSRWIALSDHACDVLQRWRSQSFGEHPIWVFPGRSGKSHITTTKSAWKRLFREAGLEDFLWRDLRHDFGSHLAQEDVNIYAIKDAMGHASISMTSRYAHLSPTYRAQCVGALDERRRRLASEAVRQAQ